MNVTRAENPEMSASSTTASPDSKATTPDTEPTVRLLNSRRSRTRRTNSDAACSDAPTARTSIRHEPDVPIQPNPTRRSPPNAGDVDTMQNDSVGLSRLATSRRIAETAGEAAPRDATTASDTEWAAGMLTDHHQAKTGPQRSHRHGERAAGQPHQQTGPSCAAPNSTHAPQTAQGCAQACPARDARDRTQPQTNQYEPTKTSPRIGERVAGSKPAPDPSQADFPHGQPQPQPSPPHAETPQQPAPDHQPSHRCRGQTGNRSQSPHLHNIQPPRSRKRLHRHRHNQEPLTKQERISGIGNRLHHVLPPDTAIPSNRHRRRHRQMQTSRQHGPIHTTNRHRPLTRIHTSYRGGLDPAERRALVLEHPLLQPIHHGEPGGVGTKR